MSKAAKSRRVRACVHACAHCRQGRPFRMPHMRVPRVCTAARAVRMTPLVPHCQRLGGIQEGAKTPTHTMSTNSRVLTTHMPCVFSLPLYRGAGGNPEDGFEIRACVCNLSTSATTERVPNAMCILIARREPQGTITSQKVTHQKNPRDPFPCGHWCTCTKNPEGRQRSRLPRCVH